MRDFEMTNDDGSALDEPIPYQLGPEALAVDEAPVMPVRWVELDESEAVS